jgi:hypothetical protein
MLAYVPPDRTASRPSPTIRAISRSAAFQTYELAVWNP